MNANLMTAASLTSLDHERLKQKYIECFDIHTTNAATWLEVVTALMDRGCSRGMLLNWGVEAGYDRKYVSGVLSRILCSAGRRQRKKGAGRKSSPEVLALLAYARERYGENYLKALRAAWRTGKKQLPPEDVPAARKAGLALLWPHNKKPRLLWVHNN
jgi:hypothetical protein